MGEVQSWRENGGLLEGGPPTRRGDDVGQAEALYPSALTG